MAARAVPRAISYVAARAGAPKRGLARRGRRGSAGYCIGLEKLLAPFGPAGGGRFGPQTLILLLGGVWGPPVEMLLVTNVDKTDKRPAEPKCKENHGELVPYV